MKGQDEPDRKESENMESISKYNIHGIEYVKLTELNELIRDMKRKASAGTEPGYMEPDKDKRMAAMLALNHLGAVLNKEQAEAKLHERLEKARQETQEETEEEPGSFMVYKPGDNPREYWWFIEWRKHKPIIGQIDGMVFTYAGMAQNVAARLGEGWKVVDVSPEECYKAEKLLAAIFDEDGSRAEDGDDGWADGIGQAFIPD